MPHMWHEGSLIGIKDKMHRKLVNINAINPDPRRLILMNNSVFVGPVLLI